LEKERSSKMTMETLETTRRYVCLACGAVTFNPREILGGEKHCTQCDGKCTPYIYPPKRYRVYNAGPWFWREARIAVTEMWEELRVDSRLDVYSPLHCMPLNCNVYLDLPMDAKPEDYFAKARTRTPEQQKKVFEEDVKQVLEADFIVAMIEKWDPGTIFELAGGFFLRHARGAQVRQHRVIHTPYLIAWSYEPTRNANLMIACSVDMFCNSPEGVHQAITHQVEEIER
jgi:hypothetical protein